MVADVALTPPLKPTPVGTDQLYLIPDGTIPLIVFAGLIENDVPLQVMVLIGVIAATGLIVIVTVNVEPVAEPETGVTV